MLSVSPTDRIFILAGAGVSAESGIPTFRGVGGLWHKYRIEEVASPDAWHRDARLVWISIQCVGVVAPRRDFTDSHSPEAAIIQNIRVPRALAGACQRRELGRHTPLMPSTITNNESKMPHRNIFKRCES
jgi:hypothetical protein